MRLDIAEHDRSHRGDAIVRAAAANDYSSALYLGLLHPSESLPPWSRFTTGVPAALSPPPGLERVARRVAALQGCEEGVAGVSTLHLCWDLFGILARRPMVIYLDDGAYPIVRWGVERAAARGVPVRKFAHHDAASLRNAIALKSRADCQSIPVVVTDGFCPDCGKTAPLREYLECLRTSDQRQDLRPDRREPQSKHRGFGQTRQHGGLLVVDDTQALGVLGHSPDASPPYGKQGGGSLRYLGVSGPEVIVLSSMGKAFGVPLAILSGSRAAVSVFKERSETRTHCSPPSIAVLRAAEQALQLNQTHGEALRMRLAHLIKRFRRIALSSGLQFTGGLFPVQTMRPTSDTDTLQLHEHLVRKGFRAVLRKAPSHGGLRISFVITARHTSAGIDRAVAALREGFDD